MKRAFKVVWTYRLLSLAVITALIGLTLQVLGYHTAMKWLLGSVAIVELVPLLRSMVDDFRSGSYGIDILAATAIVFSVVLGESWAAIVLVIMITGGESLEAYAERRAGSELSSLLKQAPTIAHLVKSRKIIDVKASEVRAGDNIIIKPGESVPVDAEITDGEGYFDESNLTGESLPLTKGVGDQLLSGSINQQAAITAKALRSAADSQYQQIVRLVRSAAASKAPFVRLADRYSIPFSVAAFGIGAAVWIITGDATRFLEVIVVATPCPLLLAAPIALVSGMARASKFGIIVKSGAALEKLAEVRTVVFDKTGTLTTGKISVSSIQTFNDHTESEVLALAASLEQNSSHVMAIAVTDAATARQIKVARAKHILEIPGKGLQAHLKGDNVLVGSLSFLQEHNVALPSQFKPAAIKQSAVYVARSGQLAGALLLEDTLREESSATLARLKKLGIRHTVLLTGDNAASGRKVATELGINKMFAEALPGEKLQILEAITERPVAFIGDGVNDAPSLSASDIGIAIGARGSTAASEAADMVILPDDLGRVAIAIAVAQRTFKIATQSILVGIGLSLALMLVFATGKFTPLTGAIVQEVVDVVVILNALRAHSGKLG